MILETNVFKETGGVPLAHCMHGRAEKSVASSVLSVQGANVLWGLGFSPGDKIGTSMGGGHLPLHNTT